MKQVEITAYLNDDMHKKVQELQTQGFVISKRGRVEDRYLSQEVDSLSTDNMLDILSHSVLLRYLKENDRICKQITYKKKEYSNGEVLSEEKYNIPCDDLNTAEKLFSALGFKTLVDVRYDVIEMKKEEFHFAFQNVDRLGVLLECESPHDFSNASLDDIKKEKENLLNLLKSFGLNLSENTDVKKARELLLINMED